jgi:hypothetical protein
MEKIYWPAGLIVYVSAYPYINPSSGRIMENIEPCDPSSSVLHVNGFYCWAGAIINQPEPIALVFDFL